MVLARITFTGIMLAKTIKNLKILEKRKQIHKNCNTTGVLFMLLNEWTDKPVFAFVI